VTRVVLIGVSTRALAESAAGGGRGVVAADFFGDRDQARVAESYALGRDLGLPLTAQGLGAAARRLRAEAVVYGANLENHPAVVADLARDAIVLGNDAEVLRAVRDWRSLRRFCREAGIPHADTLFRGEEGTARRGGRWLRKRILSGGGHGVRPWAGEALDGEHLLQAVAEGRPASASFVADGRGSRVIGFSEQLVGRPESGATGFTWCGNVLPFVPDPPDEGRLAAQLARAAELLTRHYGLRGLNGVDVMVGRGPDGLPCARLIEVNPRYCASMELAERAFGIDAYSLHLAALAGRLAEVSPTASPASGYYGKAVVYARRAITTQCTDGWFERGRRDIPHAGQHVAAGHPLCTVLARGADREACLEQLWRRVAAVYGETHSGREDRRERTPHPHHRSHAQAGDRHA